ncbi:hypothetical protein EV714DRAFT_218150, partial [Schizophyllum commune]
LHAVRQGGEDEPDENEPDEDEPDENEPDEDEGGHGATTATETVSVGSTGSATGSHTSDRSSATGTIDSERRSDDDDTKSRSIALGIVIPVLVICLVALAFWYRKRRQNKMLMRDARERRMRDPLLPMANKPATAGMQTLASRPSASATAPTTIFSPHSNSTSSRGAMPVSPPGPAVERLAPSPTTQVAPPVGPSSPSDPLPNPHSDSGHEFAAQRLANAAPMPSYNGDSSSPSTDRDHPTIDIPTCLQPGGGKPSPPTSPNLSEEHPPAVHALEAQAMRGGEEHPPPFQAPAESDCPSAFSVDEKGRTRLSWRRLSSRLSGQAGQDGRRNSFETQGRVTPTSPSSASPVDAVASLTSISARRRSTPPQIDKALPSAPRPASSSTRLASNGRSSPTAVDKNPTRSTSVPTTDSPDGQGSCSRGRSSFDAIGQRSPFFEFVAATGQDPARAKKGKRESTCGAAVVRRETRQTGPPAYAEAVADGSTAHGHGTL